MPYEYNHFYVTNELVTSATGADYVRFNLVKERMIFAVADDAAIAHRSFLCVGSELSAVVGAGFSIPWQHLGPQILADNVVRFDIYCTGWEGTKWMGGRSGIQEFDSTRGPRGDVSLSGLPPAAFDIYLQITSPEVAMEAGMALVQGVDAATQRKAREMMIRDSSSLFGRAVRSTAWPATTP
jgi:hypothetical protein